MLPDEEEGLGELIDAGDVVILRDVDSDHHAREKPEGAMEMIGQKLTAGLKVVMTMTG